MSTTTLGEQLKKTLEGAQQEGFNSFLLRYQRLLLRHAADGAPYLAVAIETPSRHIAAGMLSGWLLGQGVACQVENFGIDGKAVVVYLHAAGGSIRPLPQYMVRAKWRLEKLNEAL